MGVVRCGGCQGLGAHKRWCQESVGFRAFLLGTASERCEDMADQIGSNDPGSANLLYQTGSRLRERAREQKRKFQERP